MSDPKRPRRSAGRPAQRQGPTAMFSRRLDAGLLADFQAYVRGLEPRTTDTAVLEMVLRDFLRQKRGQP